MKKLVIFIQNLLARKGWWKGQKQFTISYNLMWVLIILGIALLPVVVALVILAAILYAIWWLAGKFLKALIIFGKWLLALLIAFWEWLKGLFHRRPREKKKEKKNWWWLLLLLLLLLLLGLFKWCGGKEETTPEPEEIEIVTPMQAWNDVVYYRIHLDDLHHDSRLIGLKNRGLKRATEAEYHGDALAESEEVVENEWTTLVNEQVHVDLNRHQMAATILYAMRSGRYGFPKSDFLKSLNEGNFSKASKDILKLHKADGSVRVNGREATCYLYELRLIFEGGLSVQEVLDCHRLSYKLYPLEKGYKQEELKQVILTKGVQNATVRELLERTAQ